MTSNEMEIGIIGSGKAGKNFAHAIQSLPNVKVRAFCAAHEKNAKAAAELFDAPIWTSDYQSILKDDRVDAVIVASPDEFHCKQTVMAANAGKHVLCEKPMCRSIQEADMMISAAADSNIVLMVGFVERYNHPCMEAKKKIDEGEIGAPKMILARRCHLRSVVRGRTWLNDRETGGVLNYAGTHNIDLICWFMGSAPSRVYAEMDQLILKSQDFTDCAVMTFKFPNNAIAVLYETFAYPAEYPHGVDRSIEILGDSGVMHIDFMSQPLKVFSQGGYKLSDSVSWPLIDGNVKGAIFTEVEHFIRCIREGKRPLTGGKEGRLSIKIANAARQASESGKAVNL